MKAPDAPFYLNVNFQRRAGAIVWFKGRGHGPQQHRPHLEDGRHPGGHPTATDQPLRQEDIS